MDRLVIRDGELRGAITSVRASRTEFAQAVSRTDALQQAVGHRRLSDALQAFESRWSVRREKLVSTLDIIEKQLQGVLDTFGEWDRANTSTPQSSGTAAPQATSTAAAAPAAPAAPLGSAPGSGPSAAPAPAPAPAPMPAAPDSVTRPVDTLPPTDPSLPSDAAPSSPEAEVDPLPEDTDAPPVLPGSPEAINGLLDRLETLADTPAGLAALAGSVGALIVLLALFAPGSAAAPGLAAVDGARVQKLLERYTAGTEDKLGELTRTPAPSGVSVELDIEQQLDELEVGPETESELPVEAEESASADEPDDAAEVDTEAGDGAVDPDSETAGSGSMPLGEAPDTPQPAADAGDPGSASLADLPPPPEPPGSPGGELPATNGAFEERFPDSTGRNGSEAPGTQPGLNSIDIDTELAALGGDGASNDPGAGTAPGARMPGMPMASAGMGSMAAASAGHAATSSQVKGLDARSDDERLAAVRRELDELRNPTTDKDDKS